LAAIAAAAGMLNGSATNGTTRQRSS